MKQTTGDGRNNEREWVEGGMREHSTTRFGERFDVVTIGEVWRKARPIEGKSPTEWRRDMCGATIRLFDYNNTTSRFGWEIDHILPVAKHGLDDLENLQPLHWRNNREKGDGDLRCVVSDADPA